MSFSPSTRSRYSFSIRMSMHFCPQEGDKVNMTLQSCSPDQQNKARVCHLDDGNSGFEPRRQLIQDLSQELLVLQNLPHLHDPHYGSLQAHNAAETVPAALRFPLILLTWMRSFLSSSMFLWVVSCSCFCSVFMGTLMFTLSFLLW